MHCEYIIPNVNAIQDDSIPPRISRASTMTKSSMPLAVKLRAALIPATPPPKIATLVRIVLALAGITNAAEAAIHAKLLKSCMLKEEVDEDDPTFFAVRIKLYIYAKNDMVQNDLCNFNRCVTPLEKTGLTNYQIRVLADDKDLLSIFTFPFYQDPLLFSFQFMSMWR